jgi:hypothetical protein
LSNQVKRTPNVVPYLHETFNDMRQPVACLLARVMAALAEWDPPAAARDRLEQALTATDNWPDLGMLPNGVSPGSSALAKTLVMHDEGKERSGRGARGDRTDGQT